MKFSFYKIFDWLKCPLGAAVKNHVILWFQSDFDVYKISSFFFPFCICKRIELCKACIPHVIINYRLKFKLWYLFIEEQEGFRKGKGCVDQIFAVRMTVEQYLLKYKLYAAFMYLEKAVDRVE